MNRQQHEQLKSNKPPWFYDYRKLGGLIVGAVILGLVIGVVIVS